MDIRGLVKHVLMQKLNKVYEKSLAFRQISYAQWITQQEAGQAEKITRVTEETKQSLLYFIAPGGKPAKNLQALCQSHFAAHPECMLAYGDEDVWESENAERSCPWFKPDWSPDLLDCSFYFGSVVVMRKELYDRAVQGGNPAGHSEAEGMLEAEDMPEGKGMLEAEGMLDVEDMLEAENMSAPKEQWFLLTKEACARVRQCVKLAGGYVKNNQSVGHIPAILFHCDRKESMEKYLPQDAGEKRIPLHKNLAPSSLSIVIPSKDNPSLLQKCLQGIAGVCRGQEDFFAYVEIIVVDNGSNAKNKRQIEQIISQYQTTKIRTSYLYQPMEFHFSRMCNLGAEEAAGELLLFLNDDVQLCQEGCLEYMAGLARRPYTGAVGIKLYYPDSVQLQHAGITNLPMGPVHKLQFLEDEESYYFGANRGLRNVLAVTAACLMIEAEKFQQMGGFADELQVAFNDVDLCFRLYEAGYVNVCVNDSFAYHQESFSRGEDASIQKLNRLLRERELLYRRHPLLENVDPYFSQGLSRQGLDTGIRPAYETAGNVVQKVVHRMKQKDFAAYRQDDCVLFRIESILAGRIQGYGVVLGDNNACYEKYLLFLPQENPEAAIPEVPKSRKSEAVMSEAVPKSGKPEAGMSEVPKDMLSDGRMVYAVSLEGQYRPDLVENMPDQINVGLSGFDLQLPPTLFSSRFMLQDVAATEYLPAGTYRIGFAVRNRMTRLRLWNVSNRFLTIGGS